MFLAEVHHRSNSFHSESGFERTGFVVEPAMQHSGVVTALVSTGLRVLFQHDDFSRDLLA